jgi:hypothetical protein
MHLFVFGLVQFNCCLEFPLSLKPEGNFHALIQYGSVERTGQYPDGMGASLALSQS